MMTNYAQLAFRHLLEKCLVDDEPGKVFLPATPGDDSIWGEMARTLAETLNCVTLTDGEAFLDELTSAIRDTGVSRCVVIPPWESRQTMSDDLKKRYPRLDFPQIVWQRAAAVMPSDGQLSICVPTNLLSSESGRGFRTSLFDQHPPLLVATLADACPQINNRLHMAFRFGLVTVKTNAVQPESLRFFKATAVNDADQLNSIKCDFDRICRVQGGSTEFGYVVRDGLPPGSPLIHDLYSPSFLKEQKSLEVIGEMKRIDELFDFVPSLHTTHAARQLFESNAEGRSVVIDGRNIRQDGTIDVDQIGRWAADVGDRALHAGDLCFRGIGHFGKGEVVFAQVLACQLPAVASQSVVVLRRSKSVDSSDMDVLVAMLRSQRFAESIAARSDGGLHLLRGWFGEMQIPVPEAGLKLAVSNLNDAIGHFEHWKQQAIRSRSVLFNFSSPVEMRNEILASGRLSRLRSAAAIAIDDASHRIRSLYPHPVAIRWRAAEVGLRGLEGYVELLEAAEVLAFYLACMAMVQADAVDGMKVSWVGQISKRLSTGGEKSVGTSMGDWLAIIREVAESKQWKQRLAEAPFPEVLTFISDDPDANDALQRISDARNDQAHGRGPKGAAIAEKFDEVYPDVVYLFSATEFLSEYPLRIIEQTNRDSMRKVTRYTYRDLMGDHPLTPLHEAESSDAELEAGSLYMIGRDGSLHRVRPYITRRECPQCGCMSLMYLDRFNANTGECILKGLDHAHTAKDSSVTEDFRFVGFLPRGN